MYVYLCGEWCDALPVKKKWTWKYQLKYWIFFCFSQIQYTKSLEFNIPGSHGKTGFFRWISIIGYWAIWQMVLLEIQPSVEGTKHGVFGISTQTFENGRKSKENRNVCKKLELELFSMNPGDSSRQMRLYSQNCRQNLALLSYNRPQMKLQPCAAHFSYRSALWYTNK